MGERLMYTDYHLHTYYSDDSDYPMEELAKDAIAMGLEQICFTDHVDYGIKDDWADQSDTYHPEEKKNLPVMNVKYQAYHEEICRMQKKYDGEITIRGHLAAYIKETLEELKEMGFTFICTYESMHPVFHQL